MRASYSVCDRKRQAELQVNRERWGTLSVRDHLDPASLVPELLLYDRLVIPFPPDERERRRWEDRLWDPRALDELLRVLEPDLVVKVPWDEWHQEVYRETLADLASAVGLDVQGELPSDLPYQATRLALAQGQKVLPTSGIAPELVPAYASLAEIQREYVVERAGADASIAELTLLLGRRLAVPRADKNPEKTLEEVARLARSADFRTKRRQLHAWEEGIFAGRNPLKPSEALLKMEELVNEYNQCVQAAGQEVLWKFAYTLGGIGVQLGTALVVGTAGPTALAAGAGAMIALARFAKFDRKPVIRAGEAAPAAVFHDARKLLW